MSARCEQGKLYANFNRFHPLGHITSKQTDIFKNMNASSQRNEKADKQQQPCLIPRCDFPLTRLSKQAPVIIIVLRGPVQPATGFALHLAHLQLVFLRMDAMVVRLVAVGVVQLDFDFWFKVNACWLTSGHTRL